MRYSAFQQAAVEARAGINEIDAEIDRLKAKKELLEVLETLVRQVLAVQPVGAEATPVGGESKAVGARAATAAEPSAGGLSEDKSDSPRSEEWSSVVQQSNSFRGEGRTPGTSVDQRIRELL